MADHSQDWAPIADVAAAYGVSVDTIRRRMRRGDIAGRREQTPQGFRWLAPLPDSVERLAAPVASGSPQSDNSAAHDLELIQRERDELIDTLRHELALRNREISRLHEVIASQAAALQVSLAQALPANVEPANESNDAKTLDALQTRQEAPERPEHPAADVPAGSERRSWLASFWERLRNQ